jgi:hypothetical protein
VLHDSPQACGELYWPCIRTVACDFLLLSFSALIFI